MLSDDTLQLIAWVVMIVSTIIMVFMFIVYDPKATSFASSLSDSNSQCDYSQSQNITYLSQDSNCVINFACVKGFQPFKDNCGCGCISS